MEHDAVPVSPPATPEPDVVVPARDWSELPLDALCVVFTKLGAVELLMGGTSSLVCRSWHKAAMVPDVWRTVDMTAHHTMLRWTKASALCAMAKVAVDRANGQLEVFMGRKFVSDALLKYIGDRSPSLKKLCLVCSRITQHGFTELITKTPLLEHLVLRDCRRLGAAALEVAGKACPRLKRLELRRDRLDGSKMAAVIATTTMRELRHLTLEGGIVVAGEALAVIVAGCPRLELLDVSDCSGLAAVGGDMLAKCGRVKTVVLPGWWML